MPVRFNPPPGWQVPPGFRPDSAWAPDPSWPPAPAGWDYWVDRPDTPQPDAGARGGTPAALPGSASAPAEKTDAGADTRTVAIQVIQGPGSRPMPAPPAPPGAPGMSPAEAMGATMTMAPIGAPPAPGAPRPGSGPQPAYPPQPGMAPPPPPPGPPSKGPTTGVLAALKGLGGRRATPPLGPSALAASGPGPLSIDDANRPRPGGPMPAGQMPVGPMGAGPRPGAPVRQGGPRPPGAGLMIAIAVAGLALGVIVGVVVTAGQQADANQAITDAQNIQSQIDEQRAEIESDRAQVEKQRDEVAKREQALGDREAQLEERETALEQQEQQQQQDQDDDNGNGNGGNTGTVFYWNCDAVRAAGAAPLANTEPGYMPHLDGNGNGIACEEGE
jgi:hypothetical protein